MSTTTLLRQCMHELETALERAIAEHGVASVEAELVGDAVMWMRDWMRHYTAARWAADDGQDRRA